MASKKKVNRQKQQELQDKKRKLLLLIAGCAVAVTVIGGLISVALEQSGKGTSLSEASSGSSAGQETASSASESTAAKQTELAVSAEDLAISHYAEISIRDYGTVTVALDDTAAPETVANFVELAGTGFYDGLTFHRIMNGFMMQGGDPNGDGTGGSDQTIRGEFSSNGVDNPISHVRGAISMARSNNMNSASSQFFIVQADSLFLDGQYAGFGFVTDGMDIVDQICEEAVPTDNNGSIAKEQQPVIESITIQEVPAE